MSKNLYNLSGDENGNHTSKKVVTWIIIILIIVGAGFLVYKNFGPKGPSIEEKLDVLNSMQSEDSGIPKEDKDRTLEGLSSQNQEETVPVEEKNEFLNNL